MELIAKISQRPALRVCGFSKVADIQRHSGVGSCRNWREISLSDQGPLLGVLRPSRCRISEAAPGQNSTRWRCVALGRA